MTQVCSAICLCQNHYKNPSAEKAQVTWEACDVGYNNFIKGSESLCKDIEDNGVLGRG